MEIIVRMNEDEFQSYLNGKEADEEQMAMLHDELYRAKDKISDLSERLEMIQQWFRHTTKGNNFMFICMNDFLKAIGAYEDKDELAAWIGEKKDA